MQLEQSNKENEPELGGAGLRLTLHLVFADVVEFSSVVEKVPLNYQRQPQSAAAVDRRY
jgi:hypothetical protein